LPTSGPVGVGSAAGGTPLIRLSTLDSTAGCRIYVKDEGENPTGSFKDRGSAVGISYAVDSGIKRVGTLSYGNMAMSVAANAASTDLDCVVIVPSKIPDVRFELIGQYEPRIVQVDDFQQVNETLAAVESELDIELINADVPLRVAGQKTTALEVLAATAPAFPEAIVMPVSSGGHASGAWKAIRELRAAGYDGLPRLYLVQAAACDPIATAAREGADTVSAVDGGETIAYSIANADPPSGTRALRGARATGGDVLSVDDDAIREARTRLARGTGFNVEPACATALAAARELSARGELAREDDVALVATGSGYKERDDVAVEADTVALGEVPAALDRFA